MTYRTTAVTILTILVGLVVIPAASAGAASLRLSSANVRAGEALRITGAGWPKRRGVVLYVARRGLPRARVAAVRVDPRGRFRTAVRIDAAARAGRYVVVACTSRCARSRTARLTVRSSTPAAPATPSKPPQVLPAPPPPAAVAPIPAPVSDPLAVAELERRLKDTRWSRSETAADCSSDCTSETKLAFCGDRSWSLSAKSAADAASSYDVRSGGTWRVLSATSGADGSVRGDVGLSFGPGPGVGATALGSEMALPLAFGVPGSSTASFNGDAYSVTRGCR